MELTTIVLLLLGLLIVLVVVFAVHGEGSSSGTPSQSAGRYVRDLHRQGDAGRRHMDAISDDYLRKVKETTRR